MISDRARRREDERGEIKAEHHRCNREWKREHGQTVGRDRAWFLREVTPKLVAFSLVEIAEATGPVPRSLLAVPCRNACAASETLAGVPSTSRLREVDKESD